MIRLVPMTQSEFENFFVLHIPQYAQENVKAGYWSEEEALARSQSDHEKLLPQGVLTPDHLFFNIQQVHDGENTDGLNVGMIWLKVNQKQHLPSGFIFNLEIDEPFRRQGFATQAMLALEEKARELGLRALFLHVFGHNQPAQTLYNILGYQMTSMNMMKRLKDE